MSTVCCHHLLFPCTHQENPCAWSISKTDMPFNWLAIISGANVNAVKVRFQALGMTDVYLGASLKLPVFEQWLAKHGLKAQEVAFVGDDIPDLPVMQAAGVAIAPADACPEVLDIAHYVTPCNGGHGVARHLIEQVLKARGEWLDERHAFGW